MRDRSVPIRNVAVENNVKPIRGVFFDAFKTLIDLKPTYAGAFADVCSYFGYPVREEDVARVLPEWEKLEGERYSRPGDFRCSADELHARWIELNSAIFRAVGVDGDARALCDEMERRFDTGRYTRAFDDTLPALEQLKRLGYRLGVISNGTPGVACCLDLAGITARVEFVLVSALVGWEKPAPEIFRMSLVKTGLEADEVVFVGDHYDADIRGALNAGMRAVMIDRAGNGKPHDCPIVTDLAGLGHWLERESLNSATGE